MAFWNRRGKAFVSAAAAVLILAGAAGAAWAWTPAEELFSRIQTIYHLVRTYHKDGVDLETFVTGAIKGGLEALGDEYTTYYTPEEFEAFMNNLNASFSGIGAYLEQDGQFVVVASPIKGSPAAEAGLITGDRIIEVDGVSLIGASTEKAVGLIRGEPGTTVTLKVERPATGEVFSVTLTRAEIQIPEVESRMLEAEVGYIAINTFGDDVVIEFFEAVEGLKRKGAKGLVLDLRQNAGGYLDAAVDIAGAFVPKGEPVVYEVDKAGQHALVSHGRLINLPVAVLVDGGTASAAEILAGAIQDYGAGPLVGERTFGKGTVQSLLPLSDGGALKVTTAEYLTPKQRRVEDAGLTPDYVVTNPEPDPERVQPLQYKRPLFVSSVGLDVLYLQYRLQDLGYNVNTDGFYSLKTAEAVAAFARDNGLDPTAGVNAAWIDVLNRRVAERAAAQWKDLQLSKALELVKAQLP